MYFSYILPNGEEFWLKFVADENGFQPESSHMPVAPEFPHPIPQFVLDQIEFAAEEDAKREAEELAEHLALKHAEESVYHSYGAPVVEEVHHHEKKSNDDYNKEKSSSHDHEK